MELIDKNKLLEELKNLKQNLSASPFVVIKDVESLVESLEVKEADTNDAFIEKAWDWIEDNILSSNQQDKSRLYYKQFENYIKFE